ncbi:MAG: hypothetical protein IKO26_08530 [Paludibacteraceae bacterium]|nr:hypothetical protein [Paludibacteraceae bacterium]
MLDQIAILPQSVVATVVLAEKVENTEKVEYTERVSYNEYKYGDKWMTRKEYYTFINDRNRCVPAYKQFQIGLKLEKTGMWTTIADPVFCLLAY